MLPAKRENELARRGVDCISPPLLVIHDIRLQDPGPERKDAGICSIDDWPHPEHIEAAESQDFTPEGVEQIAERVQDRCRPSAAARACTGSSRFIRNSQA